MTSFSKITGFSKARPFSKVRLFQKYVFFKSTSFSKVRLFQKYVFFKSTSFSKVRLFQKYVFFKSTSFSKTRLFQKHVFFKILRFSKNSKKGWSRPLAPIMELIINKVRSITLPPKTDFEIDKTITQKEPYVFLAEQNSTLVKNDLSNITKYKKRVGT